MHSFGHFTYMTSSVGFRVKLLYALLSDIVQVYCAGGINWWKWSLTIGGLVIIYIYHFSFAFVSFSVKGAEQNYGFSKLLICCPDGQLETRYPSYHPHFTYLKSAWSPQTGEHVKLLHNNVNSPHINGEFMCGQISDLHGPLRSQSYYSGVSGLTNMQSIFKD